MKCQNEGCWWNLNLASPASRYCGIATLIARVPNSFAQNGRWYLMSFIPFLFFLYNVWPQALFTIYYSDLGLKAELLISFCAVLECSLLFQWSALQVGRDCAFPRWRKIIPANLLMGLEKSGTRSLVSSLTLKSRRKKLVIPRLFSLVCSHNIIREIVEP